MGVAKPFEAERWVVHDQKIHLAERVGAAGRSWWIVIGQNNILGLIDRNGHRVSNFVPGSGRSDSGHLSASYGRRHYHFAGQVHVGDVADVRNSLIRTHEIPDFKSAL